MRALSVLLACGFLACSRATSSPAHAAQQPAPAPGRQDTSRAAGGGARPRGPAPAGGPQPHAQGITAQATTDSGVFILHPLGEKLFFENPPPLLGREFPLPVDRRGPIPR